MAPLPSNPSASTPNGTSSINSPGSNPSATSRNGAPKAGIRKRKPADPLVRRKPQLGPRQPFSKPAVAAANKPSTSLAQVTQSAAHQEEFEETLIYATCRPIQESFRYHVMRFAPATSSSEQNVNVFDPSQFERPVRLHRRDPRINHLGHWDDNGQGEAAEEAGNKVVDEKEQERQDILKAERQAQKEANQALIAPTLRTQKPKKEKQQKQQNNAQAFSDSVDRQKTMAVRYEEKMPWHVEDFENKQVWRGTYETHLSETHIALAKDHDSSGRECYRMLPLEKWYKFHRKNQFKTMSFQEAENSMKKGARDPFWLRKVKAAEEQKTKLEGYRQAAKGVFSRQERAREPMDGDQDADDIDFNAEEDFADDEEGPAPIGKEEEDEAKEVSDRVKKEQLEANVFEVKEQKDWDAEEEQQKRKDEEEEKHKRRTQRALMRREKNFAYESEDQENPYTSSNESEDSEIERQKEEDRQQEEEKRLNDGKVSKDKAPVAASTTRTGTPSSTKPSRADDPRRKALKRAASPNLSDASGNESSSRKKVKQKHGPSSLATNGASISRPGSPANTINNNGPTLAAPAPQRPGAKLNLDGNGRQGSPVRGSGSDVEMSDGGTARAKKKGSSNTSPRGSRPGSPDANAMRKPVAIPDADTIKAHIPTSGIKIGDFARQPQIAKFAKHPQFINMLKVNADFDAVTKQIWPKGARPQS